MLAMSLWYVGFASGKEWTSTDGKTLEAEFISSEGDNATLKRPNGQVFTLPLARLSEADRNWIKLEISKPEELKPLEGPMAKLVTGSWELGEEEGQKFALYGGKTISGDKKYPLVLALHGKTENETNGKQIARWMKTFTNKENEKERPCFVLAPMSAQPMAREGFGWNDDEVDQVINLVEAMVKGLPIDPKRIYIAGHSMGGYGACHIMANKPRMFAAAIAVSGVSPNDADKLSRKAIWMFHAADDKLTPVTSAREFAEMMKRSKQFKYTESETGGHGVARQVFDDPETHKWLFSQPLK